MTSSSIRSLFQVSMLANLLLLFTHYHASVAEAGEVPITESGNWNQSRPVQILSFDGAGKMEFHKDKFMEILQQLPPDNTDLAILSVVGELRSGKSFFLNYFLLSMMGKTPENFEDVQNFGGFKWKPGDVGCTRGIWAWSNILFIDKFGSDKKIGLIVLDTEGTNDADGQLKNDAGIFAVSTLLSSYQIVNIKNQLKKKDLEDLTNFVRLVASGLHTPDKPFQHLMILVRDSAYEEQGQPSEKYFHDKLLSRLPHVVTSNFRKVVGFFLPNPGTTITRLGEIGDSITSVLAKTATSPETSKTPPSSSLDGNEREFMNRLKDVVKLINETIQVKMWKENEPLSATRLLVDLVDGFIQNVNLDALRPTDEVLDEYFLQEAVNNTVGQYNSTMFKHWEEHKTDDDCLNKIGRLHLTEKQIAIRSFTRKQNNGTLAITYEAILKKDIEASFNYTKGNYEALINNLKGIKKLCLQEYKDLMEKKWTEESGYDYSISILRDFHNQNAYNHAQSCFLNISKINNIKDEIVKTHVGKSLEVVVNSSFNVLIAQFEKENIRLQAEAVAKCRDTYRDKYNSAMSELIEVLLHHGIYKIFTDRNKTIRDYHNLCLAEAMTCFAKCSKSRGKQYIQQSKEKLKQEIGERHGDLIQKLRKTSEFGEHVKSLVEIALVPAVGYAFYVFFFANPLTAGDASSPPSSPPSSPQGGAHKAKHHEGERGSRSGMGDEACTGIHWGLDAPFAKRKKPAKRNRLPLAQRVSLCEPRTVTAVAVTGLCIGYLWLMASSPFFTFFKGFRTDKLEVELCSYT